MLGEHPIRGHLDVDWTPGQLPTLLFPRTLDRLRSICAWAGPLPDRAESSTGSGAASEISPDSGLNSGLSRCVCAQTIATKGALREKTVSHHRRARNGRALLGAGTTANGYGNESSDPRELGQRIRSGRRGHVRACECHGPANRAGDQDSFKWQGRLSDGACRKLNLSGEPDWFRRHATHAISRLRPR